MERLLKAALIILTITILSIYQSQTSIAASEINQYKLIDRQEHDLTKQFNQGLALYWNYDYVKAEKIFQQIVKKKPKFYSPIIYLADCQHATGQTDASKQNYLNAYQTILEKITQRKQIVPKIKDPTLFSDIAYCLNALGRYEEAKKYGMMGSIQGKTPDIFINMAYSFYKLGNTKVSQANYCKSIKSAYPNEYASLVQKRYSKLFENQKDDFFFCPDVEKIKTKGTYYALIIAIGNYRDPKINPLQYATNDAKELYKVLTNPRTGLFKTQNVVVILNENATEKQIKFKLDDMINRAKKEEDLLFVFYAGHGFTYPNASDTYWLTYDTIVGDNTGNRIKSTAFSNLTLASKISDIKANTILFFVDSCFSAGMVDKPADVKGLDAYLGVNKEYSIITSSQANQLSIESPKFKHGLFSYSLIQGLSGKADINRDAKVDIEEIWVYIKNNVSKYAKSMGAAQNPRRSGSSGSSVILSKNPNI